MTVVRTLPELSYATGIAAKLTAQSSKTVRTITLLARSAAGAGRRHLFLEETLQIRPITSPPLVDSGSVMTYRRETEKVIASGHPAERKRLIRTWVHEVKLEPQTLEVKISYRLPEAVMKGFGCGGWI